MSLCNSGFSMEAEHAKLFVGGLRGETSEDALKEHFSKYGTIGEALIIVDKDTGCKRGFAFVTFTEPSMAARALQDQHVILGKRVDVKLAKPRSEKNQGEDRREENNGFNGKGGKGDHSPQFRTKKIFVGGLPPGLTQEDFKKYLEHYGTVTDVALIYDKESRKPRGFGFITFDSEDVVDNVLQRSFHQLNDKLVEVKRAEPRQRSNNNISTYYAHSVGSGSGTGFTGSNYLYNGPDGVYGFYPTYAAPYPEFYWVWDPCLCGALMGGWGYEGLASESHSNGGWQPQFYPCSSSSAVNLNAFAKGVMNPIDGAYGCGGKFEYAANYYSNGHHVDGSEVNVLAARNLLEIYDSSNLQQSGEEHQNKADEERDLCSSVQSLDVH